jgi:hypothetical protein
MNKFGFVVTAIYVAGIVLLRWDSLSELKVMPLNELGDFLAGVFGPMMLFWVVLGYMQQQKELRQNTMMLKMQADELKKSVEQHRELVKVAREQAQMESKYLEIEQIKQIKQGHPIFSIVDGKCTYQSGSNKTYRLAIENSGRPVSNLTVVTQPEIKELKDREIQPYLDQDKQVILKWSTQVSGDAPSPLKLVISCIDSSGRPYTKTFNLLLLPNDTYVIESVTEVS